MNSINIASIVDNIVKKADLRKAQKVALDRWEARLQLLKTCNQQVKEEFDKLAFYFELTLKNARRLQFHFYRRSMDDNILKTSHSLKAF
ncbi:unnamed protein product [Caenorhabditis auriculariae]|uniref:Uncharacterized protein n=1 Tax=Caenorhabditis auriculariae TaxID=2777116 RepID=A0A8S1HN62_9PELO|nr:unnamed protein product [Caenorhabditis auriculariae]